MSGFEIASAVEEVLSTGFHIYSLYCSLHDAPQEIREFCDQLKSLREVITSIGMSVSRLKSNVSFNNKVLGPDSVLATLKGCEAEFSSIWRVVSPLRTEQGSKWKNALKKLSNSVLWMFKADEVEKSTRRLQGWERSLVLAMLLCGM
jgi:hypothetical protein